MPPRQWYTTAPILGGGKRVRSLEERRLRGEIPGPDVRLPPLFPPIAPSGGPGLGETLRGAGEQAVANIGTWPAWAEWFNRPKPIPEELGRPRTALEAPGRRAELVRETARQFQAPEPEMELTTDPFRQLGRGLASTLVMPNPVETAAYGTLGFLPMGSAASKAAGVAARRAAPTLGKLATEEAGGVGRKMPRWEVEIADSILLPGRKAPERVNRLFQVNARTSQQAIKAVKDAGHKGEIVRVRKADIATELLGEQLPKPSPQVAAPAAKPFAPSKAAPAPRPAAAPPAATVFHARTKGGFPKGVPTADIGSDADILGKGFYFGDRNYAAQYGTPEAFEVSGRFASQAEWSQSLAQFGRLPIQEQRRQARELLRAKGYVGVKTPRVGVVWDDAAIKPTAPPAEAVAPRAAEVVQLKDASAELYQVPKGTKGRIIDEYTSPGGGKSYQIEVEGEGLLGAGGKRAKTAWIDSDRVEPVPPQVAPQPAKAPLPPPPAAQASAGVLPARPAQPMTLLEFVNARARQYTDVTPHQERNIFPVRDKAVAEYEDLVRRNAVPPAGSRLPLAEEAPPVSAGAGGPPARPAVPPRQEIPPVVEGRPPVPPAPSEPLPPTIRPPEPIPPGPGEDPIQRALDYAKVQVERERPGFITRVQTAIPGVRQARIAVQKALDMPKHVLEGWVAQGNVEGMLAQELAVSRIPLLKRLESTFGKGAASTSGMKVPGIRFTGTPDQVAPFNGTLYDIMQRPHLYDLRATEKALLEELQQAKSANLNRLRQGYQLEIGEFPTEPGSVHLPNVDVSESALDVTGSVEAALRRGRAKERFYKTGFDRWQHDNTFKPETNVANLLAADDQTLTNLAGKQVYAKGIGGKTRLEAMQETHPVLAAKMEALKRRLNSLKATEGRLDTKQQQAVDDFLASSVEEADLATLREGLEPAITRGVNIGKTQAGINRELQGVRAQIAALQPAWRVANLKPYQFVQEGGYRYFKPDEAEHVRRLAQISQNRFIRLLDDIRGAKLSGDFSPGTIQGVVLTASDPIGVGKLAASEFKMAVQKRQLLRPFTEEGLLSWVQENPELARRFSEATGMNILEKVGPEWAGGWIGRVPGVGKPWAAFNDGLFRPLKRAGVDVFKTSYESALKHGLTEQQAMAVAADDVRKIIPRWNFRLLGLSKAEEAWMRAPLTSVSFLTQTAALLTDAAKGYAKLGTGQWGSMTRNEVFAIKRVSTMIASIETVAILSNVKYALDHDLDVEQAIKDSLNPDSGKFMAVVLPKLEVTGRVIVPEGSRIAIGGPMRSLIRSVVPRMVKVAGVEVPLPFAGIPQYLQGKLGPGPRIPLDLLRNRDFYDNKIMTGEFPMNIVQGLAYVAESAMPLSISGPMGAQRQGQPMERVISEGASQLMGTSLNLQTASQARNEAVQRFAKTEGIKTFEGEPVSTYYDLTGEEARRFDREQPAEAQAVRQDIDRRAALGDEDALVQKDKLEHYDRQLALDADLKAGKVIDVKGKKEIPFGPKDWREYYERQQVESAATRAILEKIRNKTYPEPKNEGEKALKGYYDLMETFRIPESGYFRVEDWVEARDQYLAKFPEKVAQYVQKKLHPWATPTVREYLKAQDTLRPYWELKDKVTAKYTKQWPDIPRWERMYKEAEAKGNDSTMDKIYKSKPFKDMRKELTKEKKNLRRINKAVDKAGRKWYGWRPLKVKK